MTVTLTPNLQQDNRKVCQAQGLILQYFTFPDNSCKLERESGTTLIRSPRHIS